MVYAWRITLEGKGRTKAGRDDLDFRVQTTRTHEGPLLTSIGYVGCGIGWDEQRNVFAAFDPWVKRYTGQSSSVHFPRSLLDAGAVSGWTQEELPAHGPEVVFHPSQVDRFLEWTVGIRGQRLMALKPLNFQTNGDSGEFTFDNRKEPQAAWLRERDHVVLRDGGKLLDNSVWTIDEIQDVPVQTSSGNYQRIYLKFRCSRYGIIENATWLEGVNN
jgi:hypothetical protein